AETETAYGPSLPDGLPRVRDHRRRDRRYRQRAGAAGCASCTRRGTAPAAVRGGDPALVLADRQAGRAGGGPPLFLPCRPAVYLAVLLGSVLSPLLRRRPGFRRAEPARPAFARLGRFRRPVGRDRDQ